MTQPPDRPFTAGNSPPSLQDQAAAAVRFTARLPLVIAARIARHTIQILFAIFIVILHPQAKWLAGLIARSALVQRFIKPALSGFVAAVYEPYFAYLSRLAPLWATVSITVPLAILEPAKFYATILIAERPRTGIMLWLALQGLSLILIDRTWKAVRPRSREIWLVSRLHAWGWLNAQYGKHWIRASGPYRTARIWARRTRKAGRNFWTSLMLRTGRHKT